MIYEFSPKQDLHGYDKPWAPGTNGNLFDPDDPDIVKNARLGNTAVTPIVSNSPGKAVSGWIPVDPETSYMCVNVLGAADGYYLSWFDEDKVYISTNYKTDPTPISIVATSPATAAYARISYWMTSTNTGLNYPSTETTFRPYSNICQPEGYNIWDPGEDKMIQVYSGYVDAEARKIYLHPVYPEYNDEELVGPWMSSLDEYTEDGTPTEGAFVIDFGGELTEYEITDFQLQTLLDSLGIRRFISSGAMLLNSLMDQAQGRVRSEEELLNLSMPIHVIAIGKELPTNLVIKKPVSDVLPVLPGKTKI